MIYSQVSEVDADGNTNIFQVLGPKQISLNIKASINRHECYVT